MKMKLSSLLLILAFAVSFMSCEKDDAATVDVKALLSSKTWTFDRITHADAFTEALGGAIIGALYENATYTYNSDGTYSATLLDIPANGTWTLSADEKTLTLDADAEQAYQITISSSSLIWVDAEGFNYHWK